MAAEAEGAAAEARAKVNEAAEEIAGVKDEVEKLNEDSDDEVKEDEAKEKRKEDGKHEEEEYEEAHNTAELKELKEDSDTEEEKDEEKSSEDSEEQDKISKIREEKKDVPKPVLTPRLSVKENLLEWPHHVLNVVASDEEEVGCVIRYKDEFFPAPSSLQLVCCYDNVSSTNAVDDSEELVSNVLRLRYADEDDCDGVDDLGAPIVVAIPYTVNARMANTKEFVVKVLGRDDDKWQTVPTLSVESSFSVHKGPFAEVKTNRLGAFAVVAKLAKDKQTITKKGGTVKSSADHRVTVSYPVGACSLISVSVQVQPADNVVSEIKSRLRHCSELITASPIIHLTHSSKKAFDRPVTITIPCPPNPHKNTGGGQSGGGKNEKDKALKMEPLRSEGVVVIRTTKSSIFGGDPSEDTVYLLSRQGNSSQWNEMENVPIKQVKKDVVSIDIQEPLDRLVLLRVAQDGRYPIKSIASTFERALQIRYAKILFLQKEDEPHKAVVTCIPSKQLENVMRKLNSDDYDCPPDPSHDIPMTEGQEITLRFSGNVKMVGKQELKLNFHSHRRIFHYIDLCECNRFGNHSSPEFKGCVEFYGTPRITLEDLEDPEETMLREAEAKAKATEKENKPISLKEEKKMKDTKVADQSSFFKKAPDLLCKLYVSLPKPETDPPLPPSRYRTTAIDVGGIVCNTNLRWLASELGNEWESLGAYLGLKRNRLQSIKRNNPDAQEQQIFDMLVTWRSMLPKAYNKERKICSALTRCGRYDLAEELRYREPEAENEYADETYEES